MAPNIIHCGWECFMCEVTNKFEESRSMESRVYNPAIPDKCEGPKCATSRFGVHNRCPECFDTDQYDSKFQHCDETPLTPEKPIFPWHKDDYRGPTNGEGSQEQEQ
ncbi:hypothetical protein ONS95_001560 [Cadophora gregata]|uniref:uncharacterized protein n=1 Tax=Cadophora gregata TaxID=51156 RepID=UPI0026DC9634|nr:uncharacterized protein ONS95_001560 [Cadophora gregata]KAK0111184.1 hypothetical protein ONS95_001560 [Cadophora gregata]KAK0112345.1 hypothetical protein ONS96_001592 [Cadophora gregata f. sp. sojae]